MKRLVVFAAMLLSPLLLLGQNTHFKFTQDGAFANLSQFTAPFTSINLNVATGTGNTVSFQFTEISAPADFSSFTITNVFGPISASAFTGQNTQQLSLNVDTSTLDPATFFSETCTIVIATATTTCEPGPAGLVQLSFRENDFVSTQVNLHEVQVSGAVTTRISQRSDNSTANVQGTVFGTDVSGASAQVGINHMSTIEVTRN